LRRGEMKRYLFPILVVSVVFSGCGGGGGGDSSPFGPSNPLNVSGRWASSYSLVANTCSSSMPTTDTGSGAIEQDGNRLTWRSDNPSAPSQTGTINLATGDFTSEPFVLEEETRTITSILAGIFLSNNEFSGRETTSVVGKSGARCEIVYDVHAIRE
jgi:hypothetical protein